MILAITYRYLKIRIFCTNKRQSEQCNTRDFMCMDISTYLYRRPTEVCHLQVLQILWVTYSLAMFT